MIPSQVIKGNQGNIVLTRIRHNSKYSHTSIKRNTLEESYICELRIITHFPQHKFPIRHKELNKSLAPIRKQSPNPVTNIVSHYIFTI